MILERKFLLEGSLFCLGLCMIIDTRLLLYVDWKKPVKNNDRTAGESLVSKASPGRTRWWEITASRPRGREKSWGTWVRKWWSVMGGGEANLFNIIPSISIHLWWIIAANMTNGTGFYSAALVLKCCLFTIIYLACPLN